MKVIDALETFKLANPIYVMDYLDDVFVRNNAVDGDIFELKFDKLPRKIFVYLNAEKNSILLSDKEENESSLIFLYSTQIVTADQIERKEKISKKEIYNTWFMFLERYLEKSIKEWQNSEFKIYKYYESLDETNKNKKCLNKNNGV